MTDNNQKKILLNYIYLSRKHAGGKDQVAYNLLQGLYENGDADRFVVACYDYSKEHIEKIAPGIQIVSIKSPKKNSELIRLAHVLHTNDFTIPRIIKNYDIGLVFHVSCMNGLRKYSVPTIVIPHDIKAVSHRVMGSVRVVMYKYIFYRMIYAIDFRHADKIVAISKMDKSEMQNYFGKYKDKIVQIYNPIKVMDDGKSVASEDKKDITAINLQFHHKNIITLIKAFEIIKDKTECDLILIGNVPERVMYLKDYVEEHNLSERVIFTGFVEGEEKRRLLKKSALYVNPSLFEGFGMTAVEAMIIGVPTLLSKVMANYEVTKGLCHYYEPADNPEELAKAMLEYFANPDSDESIKEKSREMQNAYNYVNIAKQYMDLFDEFRMEH